MMGRASQMAIAASRLAVKDAKLKLDGKINEATSVCVGTTVGELRLLEKFHDAQEEKVLQVNNNMIPAFPSSSLSSHVAVELKACGHVSVFATACASGNYAIGHAFDLIKFGHAEYGLAGGTDAFSRVIFTGFGRLFAMAPEKCQPFDKNRKGMMTGEGAGMLLLESLESAKKRKATIYAEILGYGLSCDARHMTAASSDGISMAIAQAIEYSKIHIDEVDYISAHGTGTKENDVAECLAIQKVFGKRIKNVPASSIKSMLGHTMGAASAIETITCCLAVKKGTIPPTMNFKERDPECDIDCVPNKARKRKVKVALNNSQAFGGNNACVVVRKV